MPAILSVAAALALGDKLTDAERAAVAAGALCERCDDVHPPRNVNDAGRLNWLAKHPEDLRFLYDLLEDDATLERAGLSSLDHIRCLVDECIRQDRMSGAA